MRWWYLANSAWLALIANRQPFLTGRHAPCKLMIQGSLRRALTHPLYLADRAQAGKPLCSGDALAASLLNIRNTFRNHICGALAAGACAFGMVCSTPAQQRVNPPPQQRTQDIPPSRTLSGNEIAVQKVNIDASSSVFSVMCALWAAGYNAQANTEGLPPAWRNIADQMFAQTGPATEALRKYYSQHEHMDSSATLSRFISFALVTGGAPDFRYLYRHEELPPDVLQIEDFNTVMAKFYQEAQLGRLWRQIHPAYTTPMEMLQSPMTKIVQQTSAFLREMMSSDSPRTFTVYVEPLVGVSTNFRNYGDRYFFVVNGDAEPPINELRHSFLHYLIDQLPVKFGGAIESSRPLYKMALAAPKLPIEYHDDFQAYFGECLIKAIELRLDKITNQQRAQAIDADDADGFVLVRPLMVSLDQFQAAEPAMKYYFPTLAREINVKAETARVQALKFAPATAVVATTETRSEREVMLERAEQSIAKQDGAGAQSAFERILQRWPDTPRAKFGLAIAAVLQKDEDGAKSLFTSLTQPPAANMTAPDPFIVAWSHVYLGRIHDTDGERELAIGEYRAALLVDGAPDAARAAAQSGVEKGRPAAKQPGDH